MNLGSVSNHEDMSQEKVCETLKQMDLMINNMLIMIMQNSNIVELSLAEIAKDHLLGRKNRSPMYHGNINKYALPLIKLTSIKNIEKMISILKKIEITRDTSMDIVEKFIKETENYEELMGEMLSVSNKFYEKGSNAKLYNSLISKITEIEKKVNGSRDHLYGAIRNIKAIRINYYNLRNKIILSYLKLNLGLACKTMNKIEDNFQNGVLGIIKAINKSRVDKLDDKIYSFVNFTKWHIKNSMSNAEFNPKTDFVFNIHPQVLKQINSTEEIRKLKGERLIEDTLEDKLAYYPDYYKQDEYLSCLTNFEKNIIAILNRDPSECVFDEYPAEEEIKKEIKRQEKIKKRKEKK